MEDGNSTELEVMRPVSREVSVPVSPSQDSVQAESGLTSEAPPSYTDIITGKSPSVRISGVNHLPHQQQANISNMSNSPNMQVAAAPNMQTNSPHHSPSGSRGMRRTKSANRPNNTSRNNRARPSSLASPITPWASQQAPPTSEAQFTQFIEEHHPQPGQVERGGRGSAQEAGQSDSKCTKYFLIASLAFCPIWVVVCIAFAAIASVFFECPGAVYVGIEAAVFFGIGIISCTMSILVCLCLRLGSTISRRLGFIIWWLVWVILIAIIGVLLYLGWNEIWRIAFSGEFFTQCNEVIRYTAVAGLAVGLAVAAVFILLVAVFCVVACAVTCFTSS